MISLRGLTDHTMKSYQTYISVYLNYIENTLHKTPSQVSYKDQRRFLEILQNKRNLSDRYAILSKQTLDCLGKYTHRIAISNHRIIRMDDETVTSFVKDYRNKGEIENGVNEEAVHWNVKTAFSFTPSSILT